MYVSVNQWYSGICPGLNTIGGGSEARSPNKSAERNGQITDTPEIGSISGPIFLALFVTCSVEKNGSERWGQRGGTGTEWPDHSDRYVTTQVSWVVVPPATTGRTSILHETLAPAYAAPWAVCLAALECEC
jgi:hypothetical protein